MQSGRGNLTPPLPKIATSLMLLAMTPGQKTDVETEMQGQAFKPVRSKKHGRTDLKVCPYIRQRIDCYGLRPIK